MPFQPKRVDTASSTDLAAFNLNGSPKRERTEVVARLEATVNGA